MPLSRDRIIAETRSWIGTPYRHQASLKGVGCDCLGLVRGIWRAVCGDEPEAVPAYSRDWAEAARFETLALAAGRHMSEIDRAEFLPGDVLLFRWRAGLVAKHARHCRWRLIAWRTRTMVRLLPRSRYRPGGAAALPSPFGFPE